MISRPTMICVLKENTKGLTHMNKKQLWKIIEEKNLVDKAFELEKNHKRKRIRRRSRLLTLKQMKKCFSIRWQTLQNIITKVMFFSYTTMEKSEKKIKVIDH